MSAAPAAPGRLGEALDPRQVQDYLTALDTWVRDRRAELDALDQAALDAGRQGEVTSDLLLSMALWKAVSDRQAELLRVWDGGRVLVPERERLSSLIWGRLDTRDQPGPTAVAVSLPEACRLSDALAQQLRVRLSMDPSAAAAQGRVTALRASLERYRDQVALEPPALRPRSEAVLQRFSVRVADVVSRTQRGADVGGLLGPLEIDLARAERDLIVGNARRRDARDKVERARDQRAHLEMASEELQRLADRCVETVSPAPRYAVPRLEALGPVPNTPDAVEAYLDRLERVAKALRLAQDQYDKALAEHDELGGRLDALAAKARALAAHRPERADLEAAERAARDVLARRPTPMPVARQLLATYQAWLDHVAAQPGATPRESA